jgi:hypothetical protein
MANGLVRKVQRRTSSSTSDDFVCAARAGDAQDCVPGAWCLLPVSLPAEKIGDSAATSPAQTLRWKFSAAEIRRPDATRPFLLLAGLNLVCKFWAR